MRRGRRGGGEGWDRAAEKILELRAVGQTRASAKTDAGVDGPERATDAANGSRSGSGPESVQETAPAAAGFFTPGFPRGIAPAVEPAEGGSAPSAHAVSLRAARYPQIVRQELAKSLPEICRALTDQVLGGDLAALKLLWTLAELDVKPGDAAVTRRDTSFLRKTAAFHVR